MRKQCLNDSLPQTGDEAPSRPGGQHFVKYACRCLPQKYALVNLPSFFEQSFLPFDSPISIMFGIPNFSFVEKVKNYWQNWTRDQIRKRDQSVLSKFWG
jgi:hypothetical protein